MINAIDYCKSKGGIFYEHNFFHIEENNIGNIGIGEKTYIIKFRDDDGNVGEHIITNIDSVLCARKIVTAMYCGCCEIID